MGSQATGMPTIPRSISKDDLTTTRDHLKQDGQDTGSLDKLIATFDKAAGSDGKMSMTQFKSFASDNGVTLPDPSKGPSGGARRGGPPPSGGMPPAGTSGGRGGPAGAAASQGTSSGASSASSKDVTTQSDSELEKAANQGDQKALAVLDSLDAVRLGTTSGSVE